MELRRRTLYTISERKRDYNKSAEPKHNQKCTQLPSQNNILSSKENHPKTFPKTKKRPPIVWWNKDCEREERIVRAEYRKHRRDPTNETKLRSFQHRKAIKQRET